MIRRGPQADVSRLQGEVRQLRYALAHRPETDRVVGMIMLAASCDADTAWSMLSTVSQHTNRKARDLAVLISTQIAAGRGLPADVAAVLEQVFPPRPTPPTWRHRRRSRCRAVQIDDGTDLDVLGADLSRDSSSEQELLRASELQDCPADDVTPLPAGSGYTWQGPDPQLLHWWDSQTLSCREELSGLHPGDVLSRSVTAALTAGGLTGPQTIRVVGGSAARMSIASRAAVATVQQVRMAHSTRITGHGTSSR